MDQIDIEVNNLIMREMGLEVGRGNRIVDQDTGMPVLIRGMNLTAPGCYTGNNSMEFDPHNNKRLMNLLFGYFLNKHSEESDVDVLTYYNVDSGNKSYIECKMSDNSTITSRAYSRDSLKYTDIITQLNGDESPNLSMYDCEKQNTVKNKRSSSTNEKNKSNTKAAKNSK